MNRIISFLKGKGFYLALTACILAAAGSSFWAIRSVTHNISQQTKRPSQSQAGREEVKAWDLPQVQVENKVKDVPKPSAQPLPQQPSSSGPSAVLRQGTALPESAVSAVPSFVKPAAGQISQSFSGDELVYNKTLKDWRTHNGVDISCAADAQIKSAVAGRVSRLYTDDLWGQVVEVESNGLIWRYTGLDETTVQVKSGDQLTAGQPIAKIGETTAELAEGPHLHLEVLKDGHPVDPEQYFE